jgi:hypothetical protein
VVNQTLARLYRTGEIVEVYDRWFGKLGKPSPLLVTMYALNGLPSNAPPHSERLQRFTAEAIALPQDD